MSRRPLGRARVRALGLRLAATWTLTWVAGLALIGVVAINLSDDVRRTELDAELAYYATAVYAMGWFDQDGRFRDRELLAETDIVECPHGIWVLEVGPPTEVHWRPDEAALEVEVLLEVAAEAMDLEVQVAQTVAERRALALPLYEFRELHDQPVRGAVVVVGDRGPGLARQHAFVRQVLLAELLIGLLGVGVGLWLARRSTRPLMELIDSRTRFLNAAAHELKTPLAVFRTTHDAVAAGELDSTQGWRTVAQELERASEGVESLLLHARSDGGTLDVQPTAVRLDLLVELLLEGQPEVTLESEPTVVNADVELVTVALRNLIRNARRHGGEGGVEVEVGGGTVRVRTRGPGFPEGVLDPEPGAAGFVPSSSGSGFGLAVVRLVAALNGGSLDLENRPGGGTVSTLTLPEGGISGS